MTADLVAWLLFAMAAIPSLVLTIELVAAQLPMRALAGRAPGRIAIVVPAHDEAAGIAAMLAAMPAGQRILVVADNCGDDTADRARAAGAEVIERRDPARRGKGYALAFARDHLSADPPDMVLVLDADCTVEDGVIARLAAAAATGGRPVQSAYLMRPRPDLGPLVGLSGFAFLVRNLVRQRGLARLGAPALLTGSGMAFPWASFAVAPLDSGDLVEDLSIGIALAKAGHQPSFLPAARTWSDPARRRATHRQRARWEQGSLRAAVMQAPALLARGRWPLVWLGLHLLVPPIALLLLIDLAALALLGWLTRPLPFALLAGLVALLALMLALSWARFGRAQLRGSQLLLAPIYIVWKLPIYLAALLRPEQRWVRTDRD